MDLPLVLGGIVMVNITIINDTGYLGIPSGSEAQRPNSPETGYMRFNTDNSVPEIWDGSEWKEVSLTEYVKTYSVTDSTTSTNEGTTITFTTTTENVSNGTTLYYTLSGVDSNDVSTATSGNFTINNNSGTVSVSITNDLTTEGSETLTFQVRTDSTIGTIVASDTTTINDTSLTPFVTSGLLVHLDAGDSNSYPGSGTTWTDLSGNGYNGTLYNGVSYTTDNGGALITDGSNDYILIGRVPGTGTSTQSVTWSVWTYPTDTSGNIMSMSSTNPQGSWNMPPIGATNSHFRGKIWSNNYLDSTTYTQNNWYNLVLVFDYSNSAQYFYVNGSLVDSQTGITYNSSNSNNYMFLGQQNPGADNYGMYSGRYGQFLIYNRALSSSEILTNFNGIKSRYGL